MRIAGRPLYALIRLNYVRKNLDTIRRLAGDKKIIAVVKDDAYGHGAPAVVKAAQEQAEFFAVAWLKEASLLRRHTKRPFIILGGVFPGEAGRLSPSDIPVVYDFDSLDILAGLGRACRIHIELDTGMGRTGFAPGQLDELMCKLKSMKRIHVHGVMTHFASADSNATFTAKQTRCFEEALASMRDKGIKPAIVHAANSAGLFCKTGPSVNAVRPGIMLYGGGSDIPALTGGQFTPVPVMSFRTRVIALRQVKKGGAVSYGGTFVAKRDSTIATLAAGYGDGYPRQLSNKGVVYFPGKGTAPVTGRVCMDMIMVDVTGLPQIHKTDEAVLWGDEHEAVNPDRIAMAADTISYELFCRVSNRVRRIVTDER